MQLDGDVHFHRKYNYLFQSIQILRDFLSIKASFQLLLIGQNQMAPIQELPALIHLTQSQQLNSTNWGPILTYS